MMQSNLDTNPQSRPLLKVWDLLATGFYSGRSPKAPGTVGTIAAMCLFAVVQNFFPAINVASTEYIIFVVAFTIAAILICNSLLFSNYYGDGKKDPQQVVIDEFAGYFVTLIGTSANLLTLLLAFVLFRFFDISKLPPIKMVEKLPNGFGLVLDDIMAGVYACISLHVLLSVMQ